MELRWFYTFGGATHVSSLVVGKYSRLRKCVYFVCLDKYQTGRVTMDPQMRAGGM